MSSSTPTPTAQKLELRTRGKKRVMIGLVAILVGILTYIGAYFVWAPSTVIEPNLVAFGLILFGGYYLIKGLLALTPS